MILKNVSLECLIGWFLRGVVDLLGVLPFATTQSIINQSTLKQTFQSRLLRIIMCVIIFFCAPNVYTLTFGIRFIFVYNVSTLFVSTLFLYI